MRGDWQTAALASVYLHGHPGIRPTSGKMPEYVVQSHLCLMIATQRKTASSGFQMNRTAHLHALRCVPRLVHDCSVSSILIRLVRVTDRVEAGNSASSLCT